MMLLRRRAVGLLVVAGLGSAALADLGGCGTKGAATSTGGVLLGGGDSGGGAGGASTTSSATGTGGGTGGSMGTGGSGGSLPSFPDTKIELAGDPSTNFKATTITSVTCFVDPGLGPVVSFSIPNPFPPGDDPKGSTDPLVAKYHSAAMGIYDTGEPLWLAIGTYPVSAQSGPLGPLVLPPYANGGVQGNVSASGHYHCP